MAGFFSGLKRLYLAIYNWFVCFGWVQVLHLTVKTMRGPAPAQLYNAAEKPLQFAQTAALLEILHSLVGLTRSPISATLPQISSRIFLLWGILYSVPEVRTHWLVRSLLISWSIAEIVRYSFFGTKEVFGFTPSWLQWLRYSLFFILYITGISSEIGLIWAALPYLKNSGLYSVQMPNKFNFAFDYYYACLSVLAVYVPGSPHMYNHMIQQRKKVLSKTRKSD